MLALPPIRNPYPKIINISVLPCNGLVNFAVKLKDFVKLISGKIPSLKLYINRVR